MLYHIASKIKIFSNEPSLKTEAEQSPENEQGLKSHF